MGMDLELEWEEPGWRRMMDSLPRGSVIPAERFFAMLGSVDEEGALEAALTLTARGVGLDVSRLPQGGPGAAAERLAREAELARRGALPGALDSGDPLRLYWQEMETLPRLDSLEARELVHDGAGPNRLTEGLLWLVAQLFQEQLEARLAAGRDRPGHQRHHLSVGAGFLHHLWCKKQSRVSTLTAAQMSD